MHRLMVVGLLRDVGIRLARIVELAHVWPLSDSLESAGADQIRQRQKDGRDGPPLWEEQSWPSSSSADIGSYEVLCRHFPTVHLDG